MPLRIRDVIGARPMADEAETVFKKYNLDLDKLAECFERKGKHLAMGIGSVLAMADMAKKDGRLLIQCECGMVMCFPPGIHKKLTELAKGEKIKCRRCDPHLARKVAKINGHDLTLVEWDVR